ncbi:MAG: hypothetical protein JWP63_6541 [Candidatus Solibacter sp.]|nr:hypothetical protein [Candidatus Solibacter sp.]
MFDLFVVFCHIPPPARIVGMYPFNPVDARRAPVLPYLFRQYPF